MKIIYVLKYINIIELVITSHWFNWTAFLFVSSFLALILSLADVSLSPLLISCDLNDDLLTRDTLNEAVRKLRVNTEEYCNYNLCLPRRSRHLLLLIVLHVKKQTEHSWFIRSIQMRITRRLKTYTSDIQNVGVSQTNSGVVPSKDGIHVKLLATFSQFFGHIPTGQSTL